MITGKDIVAEAAKYLGEGGTRFWNDYGLPKGSDWCCAYVWDIFRLAGASKLFYDGKKTAYVPTITVWLQGHCKKIAMKNSKPGDIVIFNWEGKGPNTEKGSRNHIGICYKSGDSSYVYTIEGNTGGVGATPYARATSSKVMRRNREAKYIYGIYRPNYEVKKTEASATKNGFDISYVQANKTLSDFKKAAKKNDFVIIRLGTVLKGSLYTDKEFESKYKYAKEAGLNIGIYFYSLATTVTDAKKEANYVLKVLNKRSLQYPVFIDFEDPTQRNLGKDKSKKICEAFCKVISDAGYQAGVYASYDFLTNRISEINKKYIIWLAQYPKATYKGRYELHQYSSSTKVDGFGKIDVNTSTLTAGSYPKAVKEETKEKIVYPTLPKRGYFKKGDKGVNVKRLQTCLTKLGHKCQIDGLIGDETVYSIKTFQRKNGLTVDGWFGKKSLAMLKKLLKK